MRMLTALTAVLSWTLIAGAARASGIAEADGELAEQGEQAPDLRIEARVTARVTDGFFIDAGSDDGLQPGDTGFAFPPGRARVPFEIRSVSRTVARAEPSVPGAIVTVDTRVELVIPANRLVPEGDGLPWSATPEEWDTERPLLAPATSVPPDEREQRLFGRLYTSFDTSFDREGEDREYGLGRLGGDLRLENPFGRGGTLEFDAEIWQRSADLGSSSDEDVTRLRVDRLSYRTGGTRTRPDGLQLGRFLQGGFSEFGLLDGAEFMRRTEAGNVWGASLGMMPVNDAELSTGDDLQTAVFFRHMALEADEAEWGVGYQKTWHRGHPDRDLVVGDAQWRPSSDWSLSASAWVDVYTSGDEFKSSGAELTDLRANANWRASADGGVNLSVSRTRFPELERAELTLTPELADDTVTRAGLGVWRNVTEAVRLSGRYDRWGDDDDDGDGGELRVGVRDVLYSAGEVALALFATEGSFSSLEGVRLQANRLTSSGYFDLTWELAEHAQDGFFGSQSELVQQALRLAWDTNLGAWDLSLSGEQRFGDEQDSYSLGFFLQRRF